MRRLLALTALLSLCLTGVAGAETATETEAAPGPKVYYAAPDATSHALENQTLSLFGTGWFTRPTYSNTMVHELVHQWFGDSVTPSGTTWRNGSPWGPVPYR
ncbi:hypothetical protein AB0B45_27430 [Nonomuraea sp. NPDC049152]|uniref:hypothetical protein n=1 Tax=Nonomuraea sp. NPDC049152 TaxID=3154350 RepID=UPI0033F36608